MKKLTLKKITISNLDRTELGHVVGGDLPVTTECPTIGTCQGPICQDTAQCHPTATGETNCECRSVDYNCDQTVGGCTWTC